jgi:hypothetical protein
MARQSVVVETCGCGFGAVPMRLVASTLSERNEGAPSVSRRSGLGGNRPRSELWILDGLRTPRPWYARLLGLR